MQMGLKMGKFRGDKEERGGGLVLADMLIQL